MEKRLGISGKPQIEAFGIAEFNALCRESVLTYLDEWERLTERIGFWIDTERAYRTMDPDYIESVWWSLAELFAAGCCTERQGGPYCPRCGTALSSHEVALGYKEVDDPSVYVRFPLRDGERAAGLDDDAVDAARQPGGGDQRGRPYAAVDHDDETLIVAEPLVTRGARGGRPPSAHGRAPSSSAASTSRRSPTCKGAHRVVEGRLS